MKHARPENEEAIGSALDRYIEDSGEYCPFCQSALLTAGDYRHEPGGVIKQLITCNECGAQWDDWYALYTIERVGNEQRKEAAKPETTDDFVLSPGPG